MDEIQYNLAGLKKIGQNLRPHFLNFKLAKFCFKPDEFSLNQDAFAEFNPNQFKSYTFFFKCNYTVNYKVKCEFVYLFSPQMKKTVY